MTRESFTVAVRGYGFFSPNFLTGCDARDDVRSPSRAATFPIVAGRLRRFTSEGTHRLLEVAGLALAAAGESASAVRAVFGSAHGELETAMQLLLAIDAGDGVSAPRFVYSVHSTAAGLLSIATKNHRPATAVAAGRATVAAALLEAALLLDEEPTPVLVVVGDEPVPQELSDAYLHEPCAAAFVLSRPCVDTPHFTLRRGTEGLPGDEAFPALRASPTLPAVRLVAALEQRQRATVTAGALFGVDPLIVELAP